VIGSSKIAGFGTGDWISLRIICMSFRERRRNVQKSNAISKAGERELVITRIFDLPRELVWRAWADPKHIQR
jgi:hypothetical protein